MEIPIFERIRAGLDKVWKVCSAVFVSKHGFGVEVGDSF